MELSDWLPDGPAGWAVLAALVAGLVWLGARFLPGKAFAGPAARRIAKKRGWLVKTGDGETGELSGGGNPEASWEQRLPRTHLEFLGEHRGYVFHAFQQRTRRHARSGAPDGSSYEWRYDYVVSIATSATPYDGYFTRNLRAPVTDLRKAIYPAFLEWERPIVARFEYGANDELAEIRRGQGIVSTARRGERLSGKSLVEHVDQLIAAAPN